MRWWKTRLKVVRACGRACEMHRAEYTGCAQVGKIRFIEGDGELGGHRFGKRYWVSQAMKNIVENN